jgi:hypothetical protein
MFCASKTPGLRNRTARATSKSDPLALVVWATTVARERLVEPVAGTLKIKHGRIFATIPRSTSQTSPRRGLAIVSLSCVQVEEHLLRDGDETIVTDIPRFALHHLPEEQTCSLMFFRVAERLE